MSNGVRYLLHRDGRYYARLLPVQRSEGFGVEAFHEQPDAERQFPEELRQGDEDLGG